MITLVHNRAGWMLVPHQATPRGLFNLEFGRVYISFYHTSSSLDTFRLSGVNPGEKNLVLNSSAHMRPMRRIN